MIALFLILSFFLQGLPTRAAEDGTVTGTVRDADGRPAVGVRIAARPSATEEVKGGVSYVSLAETDAEGRYRLEGIPPGRFVILGGWIELPTYYPGTLEVKDASQVTINPGRTVSGIDFTLRSPTGLTIPIKLLVEGGGKIPDLNNGSPPRIRLMNELNGGTAFETSLNDTSVTFPISLIPGLYYPFVENLPLGYSVKSIAYGPQGVRFIRLDLADFIQPANPLPPPKFSSELKITLVSPATAEGQ